MGYDRRRNKPYCVRCMVSERHWLLLKSYCEKHDLTISEVVRDALTSKLDGISMAGVKE